MNKTLRAQLTVTYRDEPLAVIENLPGYGAELTPAQLRALSAALLAVANDAESLCEQTRRYGPAKRDYRLDGTPPPVHHPETL